MCGLAGFCDFSRKSDEQTLINMTEVLHHRGPDDNGYSFYESEYVNIGLGHKRLSILDLSSHGHQPMAFEHLEIIYNGEVYNFKEIREELIKDGYNFHSDSDTEVILKAYHQWGIKAVDRFNGMFSITIYDNKNDKLLFIRDRSGVKPFYYYNKDNLILFSSELKSFHKHQNFHKEINIDALALFLQFGYIPEPYSIFHSTYKLKAGHYIEINLETKEVNEIKYWDVIDFYNKPKLDLSENEAILETEKLMKSAFEYRMVSDVPVGVFLSGGYDSSVVTAILQNQRTEKLNTFTIGFKENGFDEAPYAKQVANYLGTNHTEYYCTQKDALDIIPKLSEIYDEPFGDSSAIPTILVSQLAKQHVSVSLSADGGDEIFAGYNRYEDTLKYFYQANKLPMPIKSILNVLLSNLKPKHIPLFNKTYNFETKYYKFLELLDSENIIQVLKNVSQNITEYEIRDFLKSDFELKSKINILSSGIIKNDCLNKMLAVDYKSYMMDDVLVKVDKATMSVSLEGREPFLDYRIIEFVSQLPSNYKLNGNETKWLLKKIAHKYLPKDMMDRPKKGFGVPIQEWFKDELKVFFLEYINIERLEKENIFQAKKIIELRDRYLQGEKVNVLTLWYVLVFEMWYEEWMK